MVTQSFLLTVVRMYFLLVTVLLVLVLVPFVTYDQSDATHYTSLLTIGFLLTQICALVITVLLVRRGVFDRFLTET